DMPASCAPSARQPTHSLPNLQFQPRKHPMEISQEFSLTAKPADVWTALKDIRLVASCLPGAEVLETNEDGTSAKGRLSMRLGPISVGFDGQATITRDDESMQASLDGKGVDPKSSSRAQMKM